MVRGMVGLGEEMKCRGIGLMDRWVNELIRNRADINPLIHRSTTPSIHL
jgi:hypothetical protein